MLVALGATQADSERYVGELNTAMERYGINTGLRRAHFLAQVARESGDFRHTEENLNYSWQLLRKMWPTHFETDAAAQAYHKEAQKIANRVYANRNGNGPEDSGDGWRFRGRGLFLVTGKTNYAAFAGWLNDSAVLDKPDVVATERYAVLSAVFFWTTRNLNEPADADDIRRITFRIAGSMNSLSDRLAKLEAAKQALSTRATLLK